MSAADGKVLANVRGQFLATNPQLARARISPYLVLRVTAPLIALSILLLGIGIFAAYNVQHQQQENAEFVTREISGVLATEDMFLVMREIRRELDLFLRTHDRKHLRNVEKFLGDAKVSVGQARNAARTDAERDLVDVVDHGLQGFQTEFKDLASLPAGREVDDQFAALNDDVLTNRVLTPIRQCIAYNRQVIEKANQASLTTAQHMRIGFLMLGITGSVGGLLVGAALARTLQRSLVQLDVSVRGVAGKLQEVSGGPVHISHTGDLQSIESSVRQLEGEISSVVQRLQLREVEVIRNEQLAIVGQLAAGMAHELRNPLMPIKLLVQAAQERGDAACLQGHQLDIVGKEIVRLEESIQMFLDFARPPALEKTNVDIAELIYNTVDLLSTRAIQQHVEVHCVLPAEKIIARADATQIRQVLLNLLLNALDVLPDGGLIEVHLQSLEAPPSPLESRLLPRPASPEREMFAIRVIDSGPGFAPGVLERVFQPFMTTKETGTGLGLSVCQRIVKAHGGEIRVSNRPSGGAEFYITLPRGEVKPDSMPNTS